MQNEIFQLWWFREEKAGKCHFVFFPLNASILRDCDVFYMVRSGSLQPCFLHVSCVEWCFILGGEREKERHEERRGGEGSSDYLTIVLS